jgi:hypothetical protein
LLGLASACAVAQEDQARGFYLGGTVGNISTDIADAGAADVAGLLAEDFGLAGTISVAALDTDDSGSGWKFVGGFDFNQYIGVELFYADFGTMSQGVTADVNVTDGFNTFAGEVGVNADYDTIGAGASVVARYPFGAFSVFGKLGFVAYEVTADVAANGTGVRNGVPFSLAETFEDDDGGSGATFGIGAAYLFESGITLRAEWERHQIDAFESDVDADLVSASFLYAF